MSRPVLVHYHIFKNAGTSVDHMLSRSFGDRWGTFEGRTATDIQTADQLRRFLVAHPHLRAVSSHLARPPLPWDGARPIVFLRHPVERARSVHAFVAKDPTQPQHELARDRGFAGYVRWALDSLDGGVVIRDYQVIHLSRASSRVNHIYLARALPEDLRQASAYLEEWGTVGVVRRFDESCRILEATYRRHFPDLRMDPIRLNATREHAGDDATDLAEIREELGPDLYDRLNGANELDAELYRHAVYLLDRRLAAS